MGCLRVTSNHWGDLWEGMGLPVNQTRTSCTWGDRQYNARERRGPTRCLASLLGCPEGPFQPFSRRKATARWSWEAGGVSLPDSRARVGLQKGSWLVGEEPLAEERGTWFWTRAPVGGHPALGFPPSQLGVQTPSPVGSKGFGNMSLHSLQTGSVIPGDCGVGRSCLFPASLATMWFFIYGGCPLPCGQSGAPLQGLEGRPSLPNTLQVVFWPLRASGPFRWLSSPLTVRALGHSLSSGSSWEAAGGRTMEIMGIKGWELFAHSVQGAGVHGALRASGRLTLGMAVMKML